MTDVERKLWYEFLCALPVKIYRQRPIGNYIVDFYCASKKVAIELDGSQHGEDTGIAYDGKRDKFLAERGIRVLRYNNRDVILNFDGVCEDILTELRIKL